MEKAQPRLSVPTLKLLGAFLSAPRDELSGADIARHAGIGPGTLYPLLQRLERAGWLDSRWEAEDPATLGRPRRRYYHITGLGVQHARSAYNEVAPALGELAWGIC
jgi:PadR family transcriptional regulator, regulatory protein PadR